MQRTYYSILLLMLVICSRVSQADDMLQKLEWQLGAALAALQIPLYPGSGQSKNYVLPLPYAMLRSELLEIDEGIRAKLFNIENVRLNLSADLGIPVSSDDSEVRKGMPDLNTVFQVGPVLEITLAGGRREPSHFRLELPARLAVATDFKSRENLGLIYEPRLSYETRRPFEDGFEWELTAGVRYASERYHAYYYDVPAQYVTPSRSAFRSSSGYNGFFTDLDGSWRKGNMIYWGFVRYQSLSGTEYKDSPLVEQQSYYFFGFGLTWVLARSL